jgi:hypothetical protein
MLFILLLAKLKLSWIFQEAIGQAARQLFGRPIVCQVLDGAGGDNIYQYCGDDSYPGYKFNRYPYMTNLALPHNLALP